MLNYQEVPVAIPAGSVSLAGNLCTPPEATGLIVFSHGSGSGRFSPRNQRVAHILQDHGLGTLLLDLLSPEEELIDLATTEFRFDIDFLTERVVIAVDWLSRQPGEVLPIGLFGASTGAASALKAAAHRPERIGAVVSRGGRPDLAKDDLPSVRCPTLFLVGSKDYGVIELNQGAFELLGCRKKFELIQGASHLFEERGTLEDVGRLSAQWFEEAFTRRD